MIAGTADHQRIVITGIGLTAPNGNTLPEFREALLAGRSGVTQVRHSLRRRDAGRHLHFRRAEVSEEEGSPPRHAGRQHRHLLRQRSGRRRGARLGRTSTASGSASTSA